MAYGTGSYARRRRRNSRATDPSAGWVMRGFGYGGDGGYQQFASKDSRICPKACKERRWWRPSRSCLHRCTQSFFWKNGCGEPFSFRKLGGCLPLKSVNPYSNAASAAMTTHPDFDINSGSAYSDAIASPENLGVSEFSRILSPPGIFETKNLALSVAVGPGQTETTATP